jgi:alpha-galactosidase
MSQVPSFVTLNADGVQLIVSLSSGTPVILHFGADLGSNLDIAALNLASQEAVPHADLDDHINPGIWREDARGFHGRPTLLGHSLGQRWASLFTIQSVSKQADSIDIICVDQSAALEIAVTYELAKQGVLTIAQRVKNLSSDSYSVEELNAWLPLPDYATETMDFTGRWVKERQPQRREIQVGTWSREIREGRSGHDYTIVQLAMTPGANYQTGEVWSVGLKWSGNTRHLVEKLPTGRASIGAGELLLPGEVILASGEEYVAPSLVVSYSAEGIDGITDRHYRWLRSRPNHPSVVRPRPLTLNVWEAVYFDHNLEKLTQLADVAESIGVERFVLDDGWFGSRRNDLSGLGDWVVSKDVWPNGLKPLIDVVKSRGMEFGLWFEGEMVNPDSDLFRAHPEWILHVEGRTPPEGRFQQVVDLAHQGAYDHVFGQIDAVLSEYDIAYIKWDHNRTLTDAAHFGKAAVREQTKAIYRMFDELKLRRPGLEIESCSSGGGRIDFGMVEHADRFWTSDCNDALERQYIQRYTQYVIPPEMLGSHIGPTESHTTHRTHSLQFRAISALFGHAGLEWDLTQTTDEERSALKSWAQYYKSNRSLIHTGRMVRIEQSDDSAFVHGVVAQDKSRAIFALVALRGMPASTPNALRFEGLDAGASYRVKMVEPAGKAPYIGRQSPKWFDGVVLTGSALARVGVRPPILAPENAILIELERI